MGPNAQHSNLRGEAAPVCPSQNAYPAALATVENFSTVIDALVDKWHGKFEKLAEACRPLPLDFCACLFFFVFKFFFCIFLPDISI